MGWLGTADYMLSVENKDNRDYYNKINCWIQKNNMGCLNWMRRCMTFTYPCNFLL